MTFALWTGYFHSWAMPLLSTTYEILARLIYAPNVGFSKRRCDDLRYYVLQLTAFTPSASIGSKPESYKQAT